VGKTQGPDPAGVGHFFAAINPEAFIPLLEFKSRMDEFIRSVKSTQKLRGVEDIYIPGEKSAYTADVRKKIGVALHVETLNMLRQLSVENGISLKLTK
jgi:LDH2 family malate/lactate/ureidoglycolate dehydrogenase